MQASELVGMWKLESRAGKTPAELGCKAILKEFKEDGTYIEAGKRLSMFQGMLPETMYFGKGIWKLEDGVLEVTVGEQSYQAKVVTLGERFEMVYLYPDEPDHKTILVTHKRFIEPQ